jgi:hypothetical protein
MVGLQYFTNYTYYKNLFIASNIIFDVFENHEKRSFSNRCEIAGANGRIILSVPLIGGRNQRSEMKDLLINNDEKWQLRHWRSLVSSYNSSPWFTYYKDELADIYARPFTHLKDWNLLCTEWIFKKLDFQPLIACSSESQLEGTAGSNFIDFRKSSSTGITPETEHKPLVYQQVFQDRLGFIPGLSILDLLFCEGPTRTVALLR